MGSLHLQSKLDVPEPIPAVTGQEAGIQTGQVMNPSQDTHTHTRH